MTSRAKFCLPYALAFLEMHHSSASARNIHRALAQGSLVISSRAFLKDDGGRRLGNGDYIFIRYLHISGEESVHWGAVLKEDDRTSM